jgi:hypothetical protein
MSESSPKRGRPPGPRIRTFKPERYQDERFVGVSRDARHLYDGLTTRADDEGRGSANGALIRANVFPYDEDIERDTLERWLGELAAADLVEIYEAGGRRCFSLTSWADDQRIDRATPSTFPPPPGELGIPREESRAIASDRDNSASSQAGPDLTGTGTGTGSGSARDRAASGTPTTVADPDVLPDDLPDALGAVAREALTKLTAVWKERGGNTPTLRGVGLAVRRFPDRDHGTVLAELEHWAVAGRGARQAVKDWPRTYGTFLERSPAGSPAHPAAATASESPAQRQARELREDAARLRAAEASDTIDGTARDAA